MVGSGGLAPKPCEAIARRRASDNESVTERWVMELSYRSDRGRVTLDARLATSRAPRCLRMYLEQGRAAGPLLLPVQSHTCIIARSCRVDLHFFRAPHSAVRGHPNGAELSTVALRGTRRRKTSCRNRSQFECRPCRRSMPSFAGTSFISFRSPLCWHFSFPASRKGCARTGCSM